LPITLPSIRILSKAAIFPRNTVLGPTIVSNDSTVGSKKRIAEDFFLAMVIGDGNSISRMMLHYYQTLG
jgi:hypothetical protein